MASYERQGGKKKSRFAESRSETICVIFSRRKEVFVFITDFYSLRIWPLEEDDVYDGLLRPKQHPSRSCWWNGHINRDMMMMMTLWVVRVWRLWAEVYFPVWISQLMLNLTCHPTTSECSQGCFSDNAWEWDGKLSLFCVCMENSFSSSFSPMSGACELFITIQSLFIAYNNGDTYVMVPSRQRWAK